MCIRGWGSGVWEEGGDRVKNRGDFERKVKDELFDL